MGLSYADLTLKNPRLPDLKPMHVKAMADTGAVTMCIPEHVRLQLKLEAVENREVTLADGKKMFVPYAGPIHVLFDNRQCFCGAYVMGDEVLMGAIQMEDMDLVVNPKEQRVTVNPYSPNIATAKVKLYKTR